jgi:hypothetical protein
MTDPDEATPSGPPRPVLTILSPDGDARGTVRLEASPVHVGRAADNDVVLHPDPLQIVSREHCVIEPVGRHWRVRDLGSRNHTYIERVGVRAQVDREELLHGDAVCLRADRDAEDDGDEEPRHWRLAFSDLGETQRASRARWLQYFPASGVVWLHGSDQLPQVFKGPPTARRMLLHLLARHRELGEPPDGVLATHAELKRALWPDEADPQSRRDSTVANVAWELRTALDDSDGTLLQTVGGTGYRLVPRR